MYYTPDTAIEACKLYFAINAKHNIIVNYFFYNYCMVYYINICLYRFRIVAFGITIYTTTILRAL